MTVMSGIAENAKPCSEMSPSPHKTLWELYSYVDGARGVYLHEKLGGLEEILPVDPCPTVLHHLVLDARLDLCQRLLFQLQTLCMVLPLQQTQHQQQ